MTADEGPRFLVQGTLYPDVIESGSDTAANIKSHHNVGGLPDDMHSSWSSRSGSCSRTRCVPSARSSACPMRSCGASRSPGPGLGVRIIGEVTRERAEILRNADAVVVEEIRRAGLYRELWQSFAVLPVVRTVGVMGDGRTYAYPIVIRAVTSDDAMTADWARLPYDLVERISSRIINEVDGGQPGGARRHVEAARHHRVGVSDLPMPDRGARTRPRHAACDVDGRPTRPQSSISTSTRPSRTGVRASASSVASLLEGLTLPQREAVVHRGGPLLVVAGAGSGKTRVLTRRIAHLLATGDAPPWGVLAITFTNKAAEEMRRRVAELVGPRGEKMWVSTFHSSCLRILRSHADRLGLPAAPSPSTTTPTRGG